MRIVARGTDDSMRSFEFRMEHEVNAIGIRDKDHEVIVEVQDLTRTLYIYASFAEFERIYEFCKRDREE